MIRTCPVVVFATILAGCSTDITRVKKPVDPVEKVDSIANDPQKAKQVQIDLIRGMMEKKQYYAALAYIEEQKKTGASDNQLLLLEADARRGLGQVAPAEALYLKLIGTPFDGQAYHGLGLLFVDTDIDAAVVNLQKAAQKAPTNVDVRSDLGYALMQAGRYTEAMPELSTAAELAPAQVKTRNNLIILMLLIGNEPAAARLAQQAAASPEAVAKLREEAQQIRRLQQARAVKAAS